MNAPLNIRREFLAIADAICELATAAGTEGAFGEKVDETVTIDIGPVAPGLPKIRMTVRVTVEALNTEDA